MANITNKSLKEKCNELYFANKNIQITKLQIEDYQKLGNAKREKELKEKLKELEQDYEDIEIKLNNIFDQLPDKRHATILKFRYINNLSWEDIAERNNFAVSYTYKLHNKAVDELSKLDLLK